MPKMKKPMTKSAREAARSAKLAEQNAKIHPTLDALIRESADRWTTENLGMDSLSESWRTCELPSEETEPGEQSLEAGYQAEYRSWKRDATGYALLVQKLGLAFTLGNMELAFSSRLPGQTTRRPKNGGKKPGRLRTITEMPAEATLAAPTPLAKAALARDPVETLTTKSKRFILCPHCGEKSSKKASYGSGIEVRVCKRGHGFEIDRWGGMNRYIDSQGRSFGTAR